MKLKFLYFLLAILILGVLIGINNKKTSISDDELEEFPTCNQSCIEKGYTQGFCISWSTAKSPEVWCSERNATFISGRYSDCYGQEMEITSGEARGGGGIICCCK